MQINNQDYALIIGIDDYPNYAPLQGAKNDAQRIAHWLTNRDTGGGLPDDHCKVVLSSSDPLSPLWEDINSKLSEINEQARSSGKRRLYFYFSGHGQTLSSNEVNLCLPKWSNHSSGLGMALSYAHWKTAIMDCIGFAEVFFWLDCCRTRVHGGGGLPSSFNCPKPHENAAKAFIGFATEFQNRAFESEHESSELGDEPIYGGHFTEALLAGLNGGAASPEGGITPQRLKEYLEQWTPRIAQEAQHPVQLAEINNGLPSYPSTPILGATRPFGTLEISIGQERQGPFRLLAPDDHIVHEAGKTASPWRLPDIRYGRYRLIDMATQHEKLFDFEPREALAHVTFE